MMHSYLTFLLICRICSTATAQTLSLSQHATGASNVMAHIGDELEIAVLADLGRFSATGVSIYLNLPDGPLRVLDSGLNGQDGIQPFAQGPLFDGGMEIQNSLLNGDRLPEMFSGRQILEYSVVLGSGKNRSRQGAGIVAMFRVRVESEMYDLQMSIDSNPVHDTRIVLADEGSERRFSSLRHLVVTTEPATVVEFPSSWGRIKFTANQR